MSSETAVLAPGRTDILDGYELRAPRLVDIGMMEDFFARKHIETLIAGALAAAPYKWEEIMQFAAKELARRPVAFGTDEYDKRLQAYSSLPFLLWITLRQCHPDVKEDRAAKLINDENFQNVRRGVLELFGFVMGAVGNVQRGEAAPGEQQSASPSPGES